MQQNLPDKNIKWNREAAENIFKITTQIAAKRLMNPLCTMTVQRRRDTIYPTPPLGQDMIQGQFLSGV